MTYKIARTEKEINDQLNRAAEATENGSKLPGMSYEEGVQNAILWLMGDCNDCPIEDEETPSKSFIQKLGEALNDQV